MIGLIKIALIILGSVILQTSLVARVTIFGSRPDLPLALIVSFALPRGSLQGQLFGFASGLLCDIFSGGPLGVQAFSRSLIGYSTGLVRRRFYYDNLLTQSVCGFLATLVGKFITSAHLAIFVDPKFLRFRIEGLVIVAVLNSILVIGVFQVIKRLAKTDT